MKRLLVFLLFIFFFLNLRAQEKILIDENRLWSYVWEDCEEEIITYKTFYNRLQGDTVINGKLYLKVQIAEDEYAQQWRFTGEFLREENKRVYYSGDAPEEEFLIYDFNLKVGEVVTIRNILKPDGLTLQVVKVDSVLTFDGYRKRLELILNEFSSSEFWIEGVGSESGLLNSGGGIFLGICGSTFLLCTTDNNVQVHQNPYYQGCYFTLLGNEEIEVDLNNIEIIYKPQTKKLHLSVPEGEGVKVMVTNISGVVLFRENLNQTNPEIDFSTYKPGLYIVSVSGKKFYLSKKISIN